MPACVRYVSVPCAVYHVMCDACPKSGTGTKKWYDAELRSSGVSEWGGRNRGKRGNQTSST